MARRRSARVVVVHDEELAQRTRLHRADHPVGPKDTFFAAASDATTVARALTARGDKVRVLGLSRDAARELERLSRRTTDLVFNLCDTLAAESRLAPLVPTLLELKQLAYVGADQFGLAISKRKHDVKALLEREGLPTPRYQVLHGPDEVADFVFRVEPPVIVKLTAEHSSIGIESKSVCFTEAEVKARAKELFKRFKQPLLLEEYVGGREFYVSFYGDPARALPLMEHTFEDLPEGFLPIRSFDLKWFNDPTRSGDRPTRAQRARWTLPVPLRQGTVHWGGDLELIPTVCSRAFITGGGRDWGRVDFRMDRGGVPLIIDVTPNTYLGETSPCARAALAAGLSYVDLVSAIADGALKRG